MRNYHQNLLDAVLKHVKSTEALDQWLCGNSQVTLKVGALSGVYVGGQMMRLDAGGIVDLDPSRISGAAFKLIIREEDAELAFKEIVDKNNDLQAEAGRLKELNRGLVEKYEGRISELEFELSKMQEREVNFNKELDALQEKAKETIETVLTDRADHSAGAGMGDPGKGSEDTLASGSGPISDGPEGSELPTVDETPESGTEGFSDETKDKAGIV